MKRQKKLLLVVLGFACFAALILLLWKVPEGALCMEPEKEADTFVPVKTGEDPGVWGTEYVSLTDGSLWLFMPGEGGGSYSELYKADGTRAFYDGDLESLKESENEAICVLRKTE